MSTLDLWGPESRATLLALSAEVAERPSRIAVLFPAVGRRVGRGAGPSGDPTGTLGPTLEDLARAELLRVLVRALPPEEAAVETADLYGYGDADEKRAVLHGLHLLDAEDPEAASTVRGLLADALRTNDTRLVAAASASGAQALLDDHAWRQTVLKCLFVGVPLRLVAGLDARADAELARMCADFAEERSAAGRPVPPDVRLVLDRFPRHPFHARTQEG
ncbi:EboA domain-containing protein [Nocardiopsis sp. MG754419]|uniref:EboA domain-containing protein n=1 Tax=Nocardiopsis sp. MG754419 TaxID=2259865 RepID=UPI001BA6BD7E|nr:EboA domain-containing protein [Nocardiopsis sp. MG754419]MBR8740973.1 sugar phosphate isomerase [Nocardiopsis sp. MG754419]